MTEISTAQDTQPDLPKTEHLSDPRFLEEVRQQMLKFAVLQINDRYLAEDAVQEALIGALKNAQSFAGKAALKTWIFAILRNKVADILRKRLKQGEISSSGYSTADEDSDLSELFDQRGHWNPEERPLEWQNPEASFKQLQFWTVFEACLNNLPPRQARVFMMREYIGLDSTEICQEAGLTTSNLHVLLHRARLRLQKCLELHWIREGANA